MTSTPTPAEIRASRERAGLTQTQAGAVIGAALRTWQDWESGARTMPQAKWRLWNLLIADESLQRL